MKESISVSLTNAWNLTPEKRQKEIIATYNNTTKNEVYGLHVHCPNISTKKMDLLQQLHLRSLFIVYLII